MKAITQSVKHGWATHNHQRQKLKLKTKQQSPLPPPQPPLHPSTYTKGWRTGDVLTYRTIITVNTCPLTAKFIKIFVLGSDECKNKQTNKKQKKAQKTTTATKTTNQIKQLNKKVKQQQQQQSPPPRKQQQQQQTPYDRKTSTFLPSHDATRCPET